MDDPDLFAGRAAQVKEIAQALHTDRSCAIVYGDRGLGKSSLALQAQRIAAGDNHLLSRQGLSRWHFDPDDGFVAFYVPCTDAVRNTPALFQRLLNGVHDALKLSRGSDRVVTDETTRTRVNFRMLAREWEKKYELATPDPRHVEERLLSMVADLVDATGKRVLLIVDELDRVGDTRGLASFIKSHTSDELRFMLVGIAQNIADLLTDHQSLERSSLPVSVPLMSQKELEVIVERVEARLEERELPFKFDLEAKRSLAWSAGGYPWFVHVLGQQALLNADDDGSKLVTREHVRRAVASLAQNRFAQQFADLYQQAVRDSMPREVVLRTFAKWGTRDVPTGDVYRVLRNQLSVKSPSTYKAHLCDERYGRVFLIPPYQKRGVVRFSNEMFKIYVRIRDSLYEGVKERVDQAWARVYD